MTRKMKDSGIEWIGEIPEGWQVVKLKNISKIMTGNTPSMNNEEYYSNSSGIPWIKPDNLLELDGVADTKLKLTEAGKNQGRIVPKDTMLICAIGSIGKFGYTNEDSAFNQQINGILFNSKVVKKYGLYYMSVQKEQQKYYGNGNVVQILNASNQGMIYFTLPPIRKQKLIADFLDYEIQEIDNIISKTKKAIEEYKKYKQSLITEVVTKGLDEDVEMKDSGIEWIGDIPEHWEIRKIKYIFNIKKDIANELGYDVISITQKGLKIRDLSNNEGQLSMDYRKYQIVNKNDFAMNHMDLLTGWVDLSKVLGVTSPDYRVFKIEDVSKYNNEYYLKLLQLCYTNKIFYGSGQGVSKLGRWRLQTEAFNNIYYPVPPLKEQIEIAKYMDEKINQIDQMISSKEKLLTEMGAYKKSLIYETVTGKREVE